MKATPSARAGEHHRRLARRTLPSLLRYKFLHEYGYDKGEVVVDAIVADICEVVRNYFVTAEQLEPGQLIYYCPAIDERARKGKTMAHTRLVPVRLSVITQDDIDAIRDGLGALARRDLRIRRLAHEAYDQGGLLSELDLSLVTGYTDGGVGAAVIRLRKAGEVLPIRGYVADMGSWPTHKAAIVRLYLEGLTTPEIASRTHHTKTSVDRYIDGFERVRLLSAKHPVEELPLLCRMGPRLVEQYLFILEEHQLRHPVIRRRRLHHA
ncbi:MAG TPA: DUF1670 domain-containing protein [Acidimicrobiales bacterium]|nr:DUF1670 domain-containing protein [Acidimicrobiales bacterium]